jgi:hydrogenase-4 component F
MLGIYFLVGIIITCLILLFRNRIITQLLVPLFLINQTLLNIYGFQHQGERMLEYFMFDSAGLIFITVLTILSYTTVFYTHVYLKQRNDSSFQKAIFSGALIMLIVSMTGVYISEHAGLIWVFVEATTLSVSVLIYFERTSLSLEATWKYVFICSIGVALAFVGIILLGMTVQQDGLYDLSFSAISQHVTQANPFWLKMVFLFILVGFSTKMGLFPMHTITVDAHTVAPFPVSAFISTALMNVGFIAIYRFYKALAPSEISGWMSNLLMWSGMLSVMVAAVYLLFVTHLKRMSAYSSLEHMGFAAVGLAVGGPVLYAVFLHLILHSFTKAGLFYQLGRVHQMFKTYKINAISNYFGKSPLDGITFFFLLIFLAGVPPSGLFVTEFLIFKGLFNEARYLEFIILLLLMTFVLYALIKNGLTTIFSTDSKDVPYEKMKITELLPQILLLIAVIWLGYFAPQAVMDFLHQCNI